MQTHKWFPTRWFALSMVLVLLFASSITSIGFTQEEPAKQEPALQQEPTTQASDSEPPEEKPFEYDGVDEGWLDRAELRSRVEKAFAPPQESRSLHPTNRIWINRKDKVVICDGYIAQHRAILEMFACPAGMKDHESIAAVFARSQLVHAGLLAIGAKPGAPASFEPFRAARGATIRIYALWYGAKGQRHATIAQKWVRRLGTKETLKEDWVFAGSREYVDEYTKERHYMADSGELICVANFTTSTMDLVVESEEANANRAFDVYTERVPKRNTPVRLVLHLSDDPPFGAEESDKNKTPAFLTDPVPDLILKYLDERQK